MKNLIRTICSLPSPMVLLFLGINIFVFFGVALLGEERALNIYEYCTVPARLWETFFALREGRGTDDLLGSLLSLFTAQFLHAGAEHLIHNLFFLWIFGSLIESHLGYILFPAVFLLGGAAGNVLQSYLFPGSLSPILGASGAISALEGAYLIIALRWDLPWPNVFPMSRAIPPWNLAIMGLVGFYLYTISLMTPDRSIAYGAHVGGFLMGIFLALLLTTIFADYERFFVIRQKLTPRFFRRTVVSPR